MRVKVVLENAGKFIPDCYKNQKMCNKAVDNYAYALEFVPICLRLRKECNKPVDTNPSAIQFITDQ